MDITETNLYFFPSLFVGESIKLFVKPYGIVRIQCRGFKLDKITGFAISLISFHLRMIIVTLYDNRCQ